MIEDQLLQYGALGLFTAYLIFDRQVLLKKLEAALERNTAVMTAISVILKPRRSR